MTTLVTNKHPTSLRTQSYRQYDQSFTLVDARVRRAVLLPLDFTLLPAGITPTERASSKKETVDHRGLGRLSSAPRLEEHGDRKGGIGNVQYPPVADITK